MKGIFEYTEYREFLKDVYEERKARDRHYSYRAMADSLGLFPSNVFRILRRRGHLPVRCQSRAIEEFGLVGRASDYFLLLIAYARERSSRPRQEILEKALALRDVVRRQLEGREIQYFEDWWTPTIRALLEITRGRAVPRELASCVVPPIAEGDARRSLELLLELGLARKADSGRLLPAQTHLTSGHAGRVEVVRRFQGRILSLAADSLEGAPPSVRDISTLTLSINEAAFEEIRVLLRECRRQIQRRVEEAARPDRVMHLVMACFPGAYAPGSGGR